MSAAQAALNRRMQVAAIKADITALVPFDQVGRTSTCSRSGQGCTDFLAGLVQLAFHDAGTYDKTTGTGGPDGCIDLNIDENKGLKWITSVIAPVFRKHSSVISYADFVVLAANTAIYVASGNAVTLPFNWGRTNGDDCAIADHDKLPQAKKSLSHTQDVFVTRMGLTLQDITALMGAHTIGRAEDANSGYSGAWDTTSAVWDNRYYSEMVGRPWVREVRAQATCHSMPPCAMRRAPERPTCTFVRYCDGRSGRDGGLPGLLTSAGLLSLQL